MAERPFEKLFIRRGPPDDLGEAIGFEKRGNSKCLSIYSRPFNKHNSYQISNFAQVCQEFTILFSI